MILHQPRTRPEPWSQWKQRVRLRWLDPLLALEYLWEWIAFLLSNWSFLEVLEYLGSFSVLVAVIFYYSESGDRLKQKHYQAWQVINTAQGKGGSGGRIEALQELNKDGVALVGVDAEHVRVGGEARDSGQADAGTRAGGQRVDPLLELVRHVGRPCLGPDG